MYVLCLSISCYSLNEEIFTSLYSLSHSVFVLDAQHVSCCIATTFQHTLLVGRSRDRSPAVSRGIRHVHVPGVDSASKNEYQDIPVVKDGRCVRVTTLPSSCAECLENLGALTSWKPQGLSRPVMGLLYLHLKYS